MQQRCLFLKSSLIKDIAVFQLEEFVIWSHEVVSSSLACYTVLVCSSNGSGSQAFYLRIPVRTRYRLQTREDIVATVLLQL